MNKETTAVTDEKVLLALLEHTIQEKAAAALGISTTKIWRRVKKPEFQQRYRAARQQVLAHAMG